MGHGPWAMGWEDAVTHPWVSVAVLPPSAALSYLDSVPVTATLGKRIPVHRNRQREAQHQFILGRVWIGGELRIVLR
ncbi:hypothetical protein M758_12G171000 [Ceratodon purpureus]|nr:hypothetical protein M758_12G171000 [Ceratodon purpureus]